MRIVNFFSLKDDVSLVDISGEAIHINKGHFNHWLEAETDELVWPQPLCGYYLATPSEFWGVGYPKERKLKRLVEYAKQHQLITNDSSYAILPNS